MHIWTFHSYKLKYHEANAKVRLQYSEVLCAVNYAGGPGDRHVGVSNFNR